MVSSELYFLLLGVLVGFLVQIIYDLIGGMLADSPRKLKKRNIHVLQFTIGAIMFFIIALILWFLMMP